MKFQSKYKELRLIVEPERTELTNAGRKIVPGKAIEFKNFLYETEDKKEIKFIKEHRMFGVNIFVMKSEEEQEDELIAKAEEVKAKRSGKGSVADAVEAKATGKK